MRLLVLGHFSLDVYPSADGTHHEAYGGIYHAVRTLSSVCADGDTIIPVCGVQKTDARAWVDHLKSLPRVDPSGVFTMETPTPRVFYQRSGTHFRVQCSPEIAPPLPFEKIRRHLEVDGILVNMVSGQDLSLETMDEIRMAVFFY